MRTVTATDGDLGTAAMRFADAISFDLNDVVTEQPQIAPVLLHLLGSLSAGLFELARASAAPNS